MFKIAICDDERLILEIIEDILERYYSQTQAEMTWETFASGDALWLALALEQYDLIFLDIELPGLDGITLGRRLRRELGENHTQVIFITANQEHAVEGYQARPLDFVVKPIKEQTIVALLDEVLKKNELDEDCFTYKIGALEYHRPYRDILYVASQRRKNCVVTQQGTDCYYGTLSKVEDELAAHGFIRVHQSFLVNLRHIVATSPTKVVMSNNEELPVGDVYQQNLAQALLRKKRKG